VTAGPPEVVSCSSFAPMSARRIALAIFPTWVRGCLIAVDGFDVQLQLVLGELAWAMARGPGHEASRPPGEAADSSCDG